jgi:hypothetical protein
MKRIKVPERTSLPASTFASAARQIATRRTILKFPRVVVCGFAIVTGALILGVPATNWPCSSAVAAEERKNEETLTNGSIMELQKLNLGDPVIIDKIKASKCDFDVTISGLKQLKEAKLSDGVIQAMIATKSSTPVSEARSISSGDPNDPQTPHEVGVWLYEENNGQKKMTRVEGEGFRMWMGAGPFGGASRAVLTGLEASLQVSSRQPVFYMYFGEGGQGIAGSTSPSQLALAKFDLKAKTQERLLVVGSVAPFAGYNSGIKRESLRAVDEQKLATGIYKITPKDELADGEYGFCEVSVGGMATVGKMFCFGVRAK